MKSSIAGILLLIPIGVVVVVVNSDEQRVAWQIKALGGDVSGASVMRARP